MTSKITGTGLRRYQPVASPVRQAVWRAAGQNRAVKTFESEQLNAGTVKIEVTSSLIDGAADYTITYNRAW